MRQTELNPRRGVPRIKGLLDHCVLYFALALLAVICLAWSAIALPLWVLLPDEPGIRIGRLGIMSGFRLYAWCLEAMGAYRLDLRALDALRNESRLVLAANHPSLIDALLILTRHPNIVCVMKSELMGNVFLGAGSRLARYIRNDSARQMIREAVAGLRRGCVLMLFPEGTRSRRAPVNQFKSGVGVIARYAGAPVQTLIIETDSPYLGKGWSLFRRPALPIVYRVRLGRRFDPPTDVAAFTRELEQYYSTELAGALQAGWLGAVPGAAGAGIDHDAHTDADAGEGNGAGRSGAR